MSIPIYGFVLSLIACILVGLVIGYFVCRKLFQKELQKNPPISEAMIKAMYRSMGVTPSQARINQTMKAMKDAQKNPSGK
jgi:uncharacterized protein YneF (UPF0154 family)